MTKFQDIPNNTVFYAIIKDSSHTIHHEGDERSRTNPGHGYPAYDERIESISFEAFTNKTQWEDRIRQLTIKNEVFKAIEAKPVSVETEVIVKIR